MASRIEEFDEVILCHAKEEFLEKGFADASLRTIAQKAGVSTSTIYTRYSDKEGLFCFLVEEAATSLLGYISASLNSFDNLDDEVKKAEYRQYADKVFFGLIEILYDCFDEFKLVVYGYKETKTGCSTAGTGGRFQRRIHRSCNFCNYRRSGRCNSLFCGGEDNPTVQPLKP